MSSNYISDFVSDIVTALKMWFSQIRVLVVHLVHLYNRYIPEVLFGKCVGNYLASLYPDRSYYEYPFILLMELYMGIVTIITSSTDALATTEPPIFDADLNMEQNEISHSDMDDVYSVKPLRSLEPTNKSNTPNDSSASLESFFNFSSIVIENKDKIIEDAASQQSWQICLKLYTAESISRSLKIYFLGL